jgi:hypothetical protein
MLKPLAKVLKPVGKIQKGFLTYKMPGNASLPVRVHTQTGHQAQRCLGFCKSL